MPTISLTLPNNGDDAIVDTYNTALQTIQALLNGQLDSDNLASGAVILSKLSTTLQQALIPAGTLLDYGGATAPSGFLLCYGQAVSRSTYATLFAVFGTVFGVGDGSTTFNLPDLRGRTVAGKDDMGGVSANRLTNLTGGLDGDVLGDTGGAETHTLSVAELASHSHSITSPTSQYVGDVGSGGNVAAGSAGTAWKSNQAFATSTGTNGSGSAHNNVQPTIILNKIVKT